MTNNEKIKFLRENGVDMWDVDHDPDAQKWSIIWADGAYEPGPMQEQWQGFEEVSLEEILDIAIDAIKRNQRAEPSEIVSC